MAIHEAAARGFDTGTERYEKGRPDYPREAVRVLAERLGLVGAGPSEPASSPCAALEAPTVVELGAGTGKFTRCLIAAGVPESGVVALEPVEGMRRKFQALQPGIRALEGSAEEIPLEAGGADAVIAAQAFHWFDPERALREIHRVLRPGGALGLIWNSRKADESDFVARLDAIIDRYDEGVPRYRDGRWKSGWNPGSAGARLFAPLELRQFEHSHAVDEEALAARVTSISYISALPSGKREEVEREVRELFRSHPETRGRERYEMPYRTDVYWCARRS